MIGKARALAIAVVLLASTLASGQERVDYSGYKAVRVEVHTEADLQFVRDLSTTILTDYPGIGPLPVVVAPERMDELAKSGISYTILSDDIGPATSRHLSRSPTRGDFDDYMNFDEIVAFINNLATQRPDLCEVFSIGTSLEGRDIWVLHITGPSTASKPAVLYESLIHCREWITGPVVLYLADHLVANYDTDPNIAALVDGLDIYLAPCVNPDGYVYTWTTNRLWRKNRRNNGDGYYGVDLNRNWGYQWGYDNYGSSPYTWDETYRGPSAFSEPETQVLSNFIAADPNIVAYMDYHSYSQLILWPWGYACFEPPEPDKTTFDTLGNTMQSLIQGVHGEYYEAGPICSTLDPVNGCSVDWAYGDQGKIAFTIELRPTAWDPDGFELPPSEIIPTCEENLPAILHLTEWAVQQVQTNVAVPSDPPSVMARATPELIDVEITSIGEDLVPASPTLHYRYQPGGYDTAPLTHVSGNVYRATLPAAYCGQTPEFYFSAEGSTSGVVYEPADAPTETFTAVVGELVTVFGDDLESENGWTVGAPDDDATTGAWNRMDPEGTEAQPEDDHTPSPGTDCFVTDGNAGSSLGSYDVDGGKTTLFSPVIDLAGAADARVSYWRWYSNNTGGTPNADVFEVDITNNGTTWVNAETVGPDGEGTSGGWHYHEFQVADFVTPTANVQVRFVASDEGDGSLVEAAVDDFSVSTLQCFGDGDFERDGDVDLADFAAFTRCFGQTGTGVCEPGNLAADETISLDDFAEFAAKLELGGPQ